MTTVFFTSDLHLQHTMVAGLRGFATVEEHDERLAWMWDQRVTKRDMVWVLGDVTLKGNPAYMLDWINDRPGRKNLILGNHDGGHPMWRQTWQKLTQKYYEAFESVSTAARIKVDGHDVLLSHFPYGTVDHTEGPRYLQWRLPDLGTWLLHGHTHEDVVFYTDRSIHVGLDAHNLELVSLDQVTRLMRKGHR